VHNCQFHRDNEGGADSVGEGVKWGGGGGDVKVRTMLIIWKCHQLPLGPCHIYARTVRTYSMCAKLPASRLYMPYF